jgi:hypothetical protein
MDARNPKITKNLVPVTVNHAGSIDKNHILIVRKHKKPNK